MAIINKSMDRKDLYNDQAQIIVKELNELIKELKAKKLKISSWYGRFDLKINPLPTERLNRGYGYQSLENSVDDVNFPWFLYWEIIWLVLNNNYLPGQRLLDLGGSSSLFSYYMASKGLKVVTIDIQNELVENANHVGKELGWNLNNYVMDMRKLHFDFKFDHITSVCVYEHIPMYDRMKINKNIKDLLVNNGTFSITFDYRNPSRAAYIDSPTEIYKQFIEPSGLEIRENKDFFDNGKNYLLHPFYYKKILWTYKTYSIIKGRFSITEFFKTKKENDYTFGALFLKKP